MKRCFLLLFAIMFSFKSLRAQFLMDMIDTSMETGKGLLSLYKKFDHLRISGYMQPQFQVAQSKGVKSFEGGDFSARVDNRFMFRRSRVRLDYAHFGPESSIGVQIVFQFDVNERAFTMRDVWGRLFENKYKLFSFTMGMFARPFGFETNYSSSDRESPERGRMNQLLMKSERDLGAMITFDSRRKTRPLKYLKVDIGAFNGQGINAAGEFDNTKDIIARLSLKPYPISTRMTIAAGTSLLYGGLENNTKYVYSLTSKDGMNKMIVDSSEFNIGKLSPRRYFGSDVQLKILRRNGLLSEIRGEIVSGKQTGTANNSETPASLLSGTDGFYVRNFIGAYLYLLHNIFNQKHQLLLKYDLYDPNTGVMGSEIGVPGANLTASNIKYSTIGVGYTNYLTDNVKLLLYYAMVKNERTNLQGYQTDVKDNVFTTRIQFRF